MKFNLTGIRICKRYFVETPNGVDENSGIIKNKEYTLELIPPMEVIGINRDNYVACDSIDYIEGETFWISDPVTEDYVGIAQFKAVQATKHYDRSRRVRELMNPYLKASKTGRHIIKQKHKDYKDGLTYDKNNILRKGLNDVEHRYYRVSRDLLAWNSTGVTTPLRNRCKSDRVRVEETYKKR